MWHLIVHFWLSDLTYGTAQAGTFPTHTMCDVVGMDFLLHFPHSSYYDCFFK
jgi:hypothetical protein